MMLVLLLLMMMMMLRLLLLLLEQGGADGASRVVAGKDGGERGRVVVAGVQLARGDEGEGVGEGEGGGGGGGRGGEAEGDRLGLVDGRREEDGVAIVAAAGTAATVAGQLAGLGAGVAREEDQREGAVEVREEGQQLGGLAREGEHQEGVGAADQAEVAVQGLGGVQEDGLQGEAVERRDELLGDVARLADAHGHHLATLALAAHDGVDGAVEAVARESVGRVELGEVLQRGRLGGEDVDGAREAVLGGQLLVAAGGHGRRAEGVGALVFILAGRDW